MKDIFEWSTSEDSRGQTTIDFGVGVSIFLLTIIFIFMFIPSLFQPFVSDQSQAITADRSADMLVEEFMLPDDDDATRYVADRECTALFFQRMNGATEPSDLPSEEWDRCQFNAFADTPQEMFGLEDAQTLNVTVETAAGDDPGVIAMEGPQGSDTTLRTGPETPARGNVITAQRAVHLTDASGDEGEYRVFVRVW